MLRMKTRPMLQDRYLDIHTQKNKLQHEQIAELKRDKKLKETTRKTSKTVVTCNNCSYVCITDAT